MNKFRFYTVYKGEYNFDKEIGISLEHVKDLKEVLEQCDLPDSFDETYEFLYEIIQACEDIIEEIENE